MPSTTRHPTGQDLVCLVCRKGDNIDIDHVVNRGMGGSKERDVPENKVPLCRECHTAKTNGVLETRIREARFTNRPWKLFYEWRRRTSSAPWITVPVEVSPRYKCQVLGAAAEGEEASIQASLYPSAAAPSAGVLGDGAEDAPPQGAIPPLPSAPSPSTKEEDDGLESGGSVGGDSSRVSDSRSATHLPLTHEQRVDIAQDIQNAEWNRQWFAGDTGNAWITELGESAEQYLSDFGYQPESLANILRVCAAIPPPYRNGNLRFSHHVVVAGENLEDVEMHLAECEEKQWSVAEFRRQRKGTKPRVKRWSLEELEVLEASMDKTSWYAEQDVHVGCLRNFLDWLGEQA